VRIEGRALVASGEVWIPDLQPGGRPAPEDDLEMCYVRLLAEAVRARHTVRLMSN
jgi:hypothetical protein